MKQYKDKFNAIENDDSLSGEEKFLNFADMLTVKDWEDLLYDTIINSAETYLIFKPDRGSKSITSAASCLRSLDKRSSNLTKKALERIITKISITNNDDALINTFFLIVAGKIDGLVPCLIHLLNNKNISKNVQIHILITLTNFSSDVPIETWENVDITNNQEFIPPIINGLSKTNPSKAFLKIKDIGIKNDQLKYIKQPLSDALFCLLHSRKGIDFIQEIYFSSQEWLRNLIDLIYKSPKFSLFHQKHISPQHILISKFKIKFPELTNLPKCLNNAIHFFKQLVEIDIDPLLIMDNNRSFSTVKLGTEIVGQVESFQNQFRDKIKHLFSNEKIDHGDVFDEHKLSKRIYLFPYYLAKSTLHYSGILEYGKQRSIGFFIHKNHLSCTSQDFISMEKSLKDKKITDNDKLKFIYRWIKSLIFTTSDYNGSIFNFKGYIFDEILGEIVNDCYHDDKDNNIYISYNKTACEPLSPIETLHNLSEISLKLDRHGTKGYSVLVFDPAEIAYFTALADESNSENFEKHKLSDYKLIIVPHGRDINVGIGFSLSMIPTLLRDRKWLDLHDDFKFILKNNDFVIKDLFSRGIELNSDFIDDSKRYDVSSWFEVYTLIDIKKNQKLVTHQA